MKTSFGFHLRACRNGRGPWILLVMVACLGLVSAGRAIAADASSVGAKTAAWSGLTNAAYSENAVSSAGQSNHSTMDSYPMESDAGYWDGGMGWECGEGCPPSCRARVEWLEFTRDRSGDSLTVVFPFNDFEFHEGVRVTVDGRWDCTHGWEVVYAGLFDWQQATFATGNANLNTVLTAGPGVDLSTFFDADSQTQRYDSELHSIESMYKCWGWDVIAVGWGTRYLFLQEDLNFRSVDPVDGVGLVTAETENHLLFGQFAVDMLFPIGRWSFDSTCKLGLGMNVGQNEVFVSNAGVPQVNREDRDAEFAAMIEVGAYWRYFLTSRLAIRGGYEFWYIYGVGLAPNQITSVITPQTGRDFSGEDELLVHGASAGIEFGW